MSKNWVTLKMRTWIQRQAEVMNAAVDQAINSEDFKLSELDERIYSDGLHFILTPAKLSRRTEKTS